MRADYLNVNSGNSNWKKKCELVGVARTLVADDSGKEFYLESSGGAFSITLPTGSGIENGVNYMSVLRHTNPSDSSFAIRFPDVNTL